MEDDEVLRILKGLIDKETLKGSEHEAVKVAHSFMSLAVHTSDRMRKTLKHKSDANLRDLDAD